jgi:hypothetical protein
LKILPNGVYGSVNAKAIIDVHVRIRYLLGLLLR